MLSCDADKTLHISLINKYGGNWHGSMSCWPEVTFAPQLKYGDAPYSFDISIAVVLTNNASKQWVQSIPAELVPELVTYEQMWLGNAYMALYLTSRSEEARNLFTSNTGLFWYILKCCEEWHPIEIFHLFSERQKKILSFLDLPEETAVLNTFKKLNLLKPDDEVLKRLSSLIKSGTYKELSHVKLITSDFICLLAKYPDLAVSKLIQRYQPTWEQFNFSSDLMSITESAEENGLGVQWVARKLTGKNPERILEKIDERVTNYYTKQNQVSRLKKPNCNYPPPPVESNGLINPVSNYYDLLKESEEQGHCVKNFHEMVLDGTTYFYRMNKPERATIQICIHESGYLYLKEIKLKHNAAPSPKTEGIVFEWLAASGKNVDLEYYQRSGSGCFLRYQAD